MVVRIEYTWINSTVSMVQELLKTLWAAGKCATSQTTNRLNGLLYHNSEVEELRIY